MCMYSNILERIRNALFCFQKSKLNQEEINQKRIKLLPFYRKH